MADLEAAARSSRYIERIVYGLVSEAEGESEVSEARNVLRLAVGLRRMLERILTAAQAASGNIAAPPVRKEE